MVGCLSRGSSIFSQNLNRPAVQLHVSYMFFFWKSGDVFYGSSGYNMTVRAEYDISRRPFAVQKRLTLRSNLLVEFLRG